MRQGQPLDWINRQADRYAGRLAGRPAEGQVWGQVAPSRSPACSSHCMHVRPYECARIHTCMPSRVTRVNTHTRIRTCTHTHTLTHTHTCAYAHAHTHTHKHKHTHAGCDTRPSCLLACLPAQPPACLSLYLDLPIAGERC